MVRYNLRALLSVCRQKSWDDVIIFNDFESYPGKIHIVGDDLIFPQPQATPEQIIIEPFFFSILFGKNYLSGDLCDPKCVWNVLGFFTCWSLHLLFFYPKAIKMFDVEIYKDSAVQYYLVNNRNSFWNSHSFILGNEELLLDLNDLLTQKWIFIY